MRAERSASLFVGDPNAQPLRITYPQLNMLTWPSSIIAGRPFLMSKSKKKGQITMKKDMAFIEKSRDRDAAGP